MHAYVCACVRVCVHVCLLCFIFYIHSTYQISSLKRTKRELESKIEELKDELDEVTIRCESLEQVNSNLWPTYTCCFHFPFL